MNYTSFPRLNEYVKKAKFEKKIHNKCTLNKSTYHG